MYDEAKDMTTFSSMMTPAAAAERRVITPEGLTAYTKKILSDYKYANLEI